MNGKFSGRSDITAGLGVMVTAYTIGVLVLGLVIGLLLRGCW